jgi:uncharacterized protein with ATP-grasp and redox domains
MKTSLECMSCFVRQALDAARMVSTDPAIHERMIREVLRWAGEMDLNMPPPAMGQRIHRKLREITGVEDPYRAAKDRLNRLALRLLPELRAKVKTASDPLVMAARLAIAGNVIDMGVSGNVTESAVYQSIRQALAKPFAGDPNGFRQAVAEARSILYLADNAGEIVFDRLLIEQLPAGRVTLAIRGSPVINDATMADARAAGLCEMAETIDNGSDAPGTILEDCSQDFVRRFREADLILAKGQGNFETLSEEPGNIVFLFQVKCAVIGKEVGLPAGIHVLFRSRAKRLNQMDFGDKAKGDKAKYELH